MLTTIDVDFLAILLVPITKNIIVNEFGIRVKVSKKLTKSKSKNLVKPIAAKF